MVGMGLLGWLWATLIGGVGVAGLLTVSAPHCSLFIANLVKYGKSHPKDRSWVHKSIEVPKRWFTHFYIVATFSSGLGLWSVANCYLSNTPLPAGIVAYLRRYLAPRLTQPTVSEVSVLVCVGLLFVHCVRRLWESVFVSVYSDTRMNLLHYGTGLLYYLLVPLSLLVEAPGFITPKVGGVNWSALSALQMGGVVLFLWSSYQQHVCFQGFANMRKNYLGNISTYAHGIPSGDWFEYVSCPHFLFEILIYVALFLVLNAAHKLWMMLLVFVVMNQVIAAIITHNWYKERFKDIYPKDRKALIPYIL